VTTTTPDIGVDLSALAAMMESVPVETMSARPLVGRSRELAQLCALLGLESEPAGSGAVLLAGDAGVGKSRLFAELRDQAAANGWRVVIGHCIDFGESALPYLPFSELFGRLAGDEPELADRIVDGHPAVRRLMPSVRLAPDSAAWERPVDRSELFAGVHAALEELSESAPLLLLIEDVHWADQSTREMLSFLFSRGFAQPVSIAASYRSDDLHRRHPLRSSAAEWMRLPRVNRVQLSPLDDASVRALILSLNPDPMAESEIGSIVERAEGNAFFTEELVGAAQYGKSALPGDLVNLLLIRIDQLDEPSRQTVRASSVAGRRVSHELLSRVVELDAATLDDTLRAAVEHNVLVAVGDDSYAFRHALLAEAVYDDLLPGERLRLHRSYVTALRSHDLPSTAAEVARHARAAHDLPTAVRASIEAGDEAMSVGGPDEAAQHFEVALELVGDGDAVAGDDEPFDVIGLVVKAADAVTAAGHPYRAVELIRDQIAHRASTIGDRDQARLLIALAQAILLTEGQTDPLEPTTQALQLVPDSDLTPLRAQLLSLHARAHAAHGHNSEASRWANDALALGNELRLQSVVAEATTTLSIIDKRLGDPEASRKGLVAIVAAAHEAGDLMAELRGLHNLGFIHYDQARLDDAQHTYEQAAQRAAEAGRPWAPYGLDARFLAAVTAYLRGDWDAVARIIDVTGQSPPVLAESTLVSVGLLVAAGRGDSSADALIPQVRATWTRDGAIAVVSGSAGIDLFGDRGDLEGALAVHDDVVSVVTGLWQTPNFQARVRLSALVIGQLAAHVAEATSADREKMVKQAEEFMNTALETFELHRLKGRMMGPEGVAWRQRAIAEHARVRWLAGIDPPPEDELVRSWTQTVTDFETMGHAFETARSQARLAAVLAGAGRASEARPVAEAARHTAQRLGAAPLLRELRALPSGRSRQADAARGRDDLTPRERQILALVAEGRSNGDIGAQLFISAKTVSVHVSNILSKLGASGRTEAAALARRRGLLD
jgi:DNA-binding CsgD family transcriptional regulator/tetratricopeptide (TPR) repeat protein